MAKLQKLIVPPLKTKGFFTFDKPFNTDEFQNYEYSVEAVRSLKGIVDSGIDALTTIYMLNGLTEKDYKEDLENDVPIVVLRNDDENYLYIPGNKIQVSPNTIGNIYQNLILVCTLGHTYEKIPLDNLLFNLKEVVEERLGIEVRLTWIPGSRKILVSHREHESYQGLLKDSRSDTLTYKHKYNKLKSEYDTKKLYNDNMERGLLYTVNRIKEAEESGENAGELQKELDKLKAELTKLENEKKKLQDKIDAALKLLEG